MPQFFLIYPLTMGTWRSFSYHLCCHHASGAHILNAERGGWLDEVLAYVHHLLPIKGVVGASHVCGMQAGAAPPISPIEEEPEYAASPGEQPWDNQAGPAAVASPREPTSPAVPLRGTTDAHAQPDQAAAGYAARRGPTLMGPPRSAGVAAAEQSAPFAHAAAHGPVGESPGAGLGRRGQAWDAPGFGFGLHSPAVKPVKALEDVPAAPPLPLKVRHTLPHDMLDSSREL